jgi:hypothetical protein
VSNALYVVVVVALVAFLVWFYVFAPCEWLAWMKTGDIPARCLSHYTGSRP